MYVKKEGNRHLTRKQTKNLKLVYPLVLHKILSSTLPPCTPHRSIDEEGGRKQPKSWGLEARTESQWQCREREVWESEALIRRERRLKTVSVNMSWWRRNVGDLLPICWPTNRRFLFNYSFSLFLAQTYFTFSINSLQMHLFWFFLVIYSQRQN